jgi:hypothetical protein
LSSQKPIARDPIFSRATLDPIIMKIDKIAIPLAAACAVAIGGWLVFSSMQKKNDPNRSEAASAIEAWEEPAENGTNNAPQKIAEKTEIESLYTVSRASDLLNPNLYPAALVADHEQMLKRSIAACMPVPIEAQAEMANQAKSRVKAETHSILLWQTFISRYCDGFSQTQAENLLASQFKERTPQPEEVKLNSMSQLLVEKGSLHAMQKEDADKMDGILRTTSSPQLFEQATFFLLRSAHAPESYLSDLSEATRVRAASNVAIAHNAATTARCQLFGGCGSDSLLAMQSCYPFECRFDSRYGDKSAADLTPGEQEIANMIARRIIAARQ